MNTDLIAPRHALPEYPTPWRVAERNAEGQYVVVCATGHYAAEVPTLDLAKEICDRINASTSGPTR